MEKPVWVVVANGSRARVLEQHPTKPERWTETECWVHPQSRVHGADTGHGPAGHAGRSGLASRSGPQEHERRAFAQQLAGLVATAVGEHRVGRIVVFASNPFLGELLAHLDSESRKRVADSHALDLTSLGMHELTQRLHSDFHL
ncbi:hypothetical protein B2J86_17475 [Acidovorax sp. SRB_14]|uniref:host attachment protein n=1 Tax=Acidovorax sp. SRB_14 TaxID=1962699 RepID=UPI0015673388|nr:host attachment protein [Acidovorax sp. SRB_14]NMM82692.1 hypothetical protein [Acidovorax sp. SRB_14]